MNNIEKYLEPGNVLWARRDIFYDQPERIVSDKVNMFLVLKKEDNSFLGCKIEKNPVGGNKNVLKKRFYPLKYDSRVASDIYKIDFDAIASSYTFRVSEGAFSNIKRNIYKRIVLGYNKGPKEYQEEFVKDYLEENKPQEDNIIVYPSIDKRYKYYYVYEDNEDYYSLIELKKHDFDYYTIMSNEEVLMPKNIPYFDFYKEHSLTRSDIDYVLFGIKEKKIGSIVTNKHK